MSLTKDQQRTEVEVARAISRQGKRFIVLNLVDVTKNRIQGAMVLHATPYLDHATNMKQFHFEERGGPLQFVDDEMRGGMFCKMLDCEHNRKFLASMFGYRFWEIEDQDVLKDVEERAANITKNAIILKPLAPKETKMSDAEIETEMARLQAESSKRKIAKSEAGKRKPFPEVPPSINDKKPEQDTNPEFPETNPLSADESNPEQPSGENPEPVTPITSRRAAKRRKSKLVSIGG